MATQSVERQPRLCDICQKNKAAIFDRKPARFLQYSNTGFNPNLAECMTCRKLGNEYEDEIEIINLIQKMINDKRTN